MKTAIKIAITLLFLTTLCSAQLVTMHVTKVTYLGQRTPYTAFTVDTVGGRTIYHLMVTCDSRQHGVSCFVPTAGEDYNTRILANGDVEFIDWTYDRIFLYYILSEEEKTSKGTR